MRLFGAFIDWGLRNLLRLVIIGAIAFVVLGFALQSCDTAGETQLPASIDTRYVVVTTSLVYYTDSVEWVGETLIVHGAWVQEGKKWVEYDRDIIMDPQTYGRVKVINR